jgi:hypothetical protein
MGTWIGVGVGEPVRDLVITGLGKPSNTLEPSLWIHSPGSGVTLLLRFGVVVSMVGWNVLGMHPIGVIFHKDKFSLLWYHLHVYECISTVYLIII